MSDRDFKGLFRRWIMSVDRITLFIIMTIISIGVWVCIASTPAVALKLGLSPFHFVRQHMMIVPISVLLIIIISFFQTRHIRRLALIGYFACIFLMICVLLIGSEIKGARRWISIMGFSLQPSEFLKPVMTIITAWLIAEQYRDRKFPGIIISIFTILFAIPFLLLQPDVGMSVVIISTWVSQLFVSGISVFILCMFVVGALGSSVGLYFILPHFAERINKFLMKDGADTDLYQVQKSLEAFRNGGFFGKGPGEGVVKTLVPDAHSDFVFSVIGEEFGFLLCIIIVGLFICFIVRSLVRVMESSSMFCFSAVFGICFQFTMQILINLSTSLNLIPTKGMTLPFISYGGSSLLSSSVSIGILLALTKRNSMQREIL